VNFITNWINNFHKHSVIGLMKNAALIIVGGLMILTASCRKSNFIGEELLPEEDFLNSTRVDTFKIITYTEVDDSVVTSQNVFFALGSISSETYGNSTGNIYSQVLLPTNNLFFGDAPGIDSIVVTMDYAGYYGDTEAQHTLSVYRMTERLESGRLYYSDARFHVLPIAIGKKKEFVPNLADSVVLADGTIYEPHLRIKLFDSFGQNLLNLDTTVLENDTSFLSFLQGIYIEADTLTDGFSNGIMYFDMASTLSGLRIYYHNSEADSLSVVLPFTGVKTNRFTHSYAAATPVQTALLLPDSINGDQQTFVQGFGGLRTIVKFPTLKNLQDVSINKAELVLTVTSYDGREFAPPPKIQLVQLDSTGHNFYYLALYSIEVYSSIVDDNFGTNNIGGTVTRAESDAGRFVFQYKYIITEHVQEILQGSIENYGFALICQPGNRIPNAVTLGGIYSDRDFFKPSLSITYTTINK